jgi:hypothetical protein
MFTGGDKRNVYHGFGRRGIIITGSRSKALHFALSS